MMQSMPGGNNGDDEDDGAEGVKAPAPAPAPAPAGDPPTETKESAT